MLKKQVRYMIRSLAIYLQLISLNTMFYCFVRGENAAILLLDFSCWGEKKASVSSLVSQLYSLKQIKQQKELSSILFTAGV